MTFSIPRLFLVLLAVHAGWVILNPHYPSTDVFLFKEAGVNLAHKGRFVAANLPHMPPDEEIVFAYYPPAYPFLYGVWSKVAGVGLFQSSFFDATLRILRTLLIFALLLPRLRASRSPILKWLVPFLLALTSFVSSDGDRPDELGLVSGFAAWLILDRGASWRNLLGGGIALGITGATSPAAGVFFALGVFLAQGFRKTAIVGVLSAVVFAACNLPIYLADPHAYTRFSKQLPLSTFPYMAIIREGQPWYAGWRMFKEYSLESLHVSVPYVFCLLTLALLVAAAWTRVGENHRRALRPLALTAILFIPICIVVWTRQPYYLWFSCVALSAFAMLVVGELERRHSLFAALVVIIAFSPLLLREAKGFLNQVQQSSVDSPRAARTEVIKLVGPEEKLAITSDQYFTFRDQREVANIDYVCDNLDRYDYVYVTRYTSTRRTDPDPIPIPCKTKRACFSVQKDFSTRKVFQILGYDTPYYVRGSAGVLYKNTRCKG